MKRINRPEPPRVHAQSHHNDETGELYYEYNGRRVVEVKMPEGVKYRFRFYSDGDICTSPLFQQIYLAVQEDKAVPVRIDFTLSPEAVCMNPERADREKAILGQVGHPLIFGCCGLYDIYDDYLIDWFGNEWRWLSDKMEKDENGNTKVSIEVMIGPRAFIINCRPQFYRKHLGYEYYKPWECRPNTKPVAGWCSWEAYRREVTEKNVADVCDFLKDTFLPYGLEYVQIDDGYQKNPYGITPEHTLAEAWMAPTEAFPKGAKGIAETIASRGLSPAIWMNSDVREYAPGPETPDCVLRHEDGTIIKAAWLTTPLDWKDETIERHFVPVLRAFKEAGFKYIKIDALRHSFYDALGTAVREGLITSDEAERRFRRLHEVFRRELGDDFYLLVCWGIFTQTAGCGDACRVATDANPDWNKVRMQITEQARWWHTQRILFLNDPDHVCVRTKPSWGQALLSNVALTGGLMMLSDPIDSYDEERIYNTQRCLPTLETFAAETGPLDIRYPAYAWTKVHGAAFKGDITTWNELTDEEVMIQAGAHKTMNDEHPFSCLWAYHIEKPFDKWCVVQRVANWPLKACVIPLENVNLDPKKTYLAFDFWAKKFLGEVTEKISVPALNYGDGQVICFREKKGTPQFIASTRHVSMDAVSVTDIKEEKGGLTLKLSLPAGDEEKYYFYVPKGTSLKEVKATGCDAKAESAENDLLVVSVKANENNCEISLNF